jgi:hypothetical protein
LSELHDGQFKEKFIFYQFSHISYLELMHIMCLKQTKVINFFSYITDYSVKFITAIADKGGCSPKKFPSYADGYRSSLGLCSLSSERGFYRATPVVTPGTSGSRGGGGSRGS